MLALWLFVLLVVVIVFRPAVWPQCYHLTTLTSHQAVSSLTERPRTAALAAQDRFLHCHCHTPGGREGRGEGEPVDFIQVEQSWVFWLSVLLCLMTSYDISPDIRQMTGRHSLSRVVWPLLFFTLLSVITTPCYVVM